MIYAFVQRFLSLGKHPTPTNLKLIENILKSIFVLGLLVQLILLIAILQFPNKFIIVSPFVDTASKLNFFSAITIYICILIGGLYTLFQRSGNTTTSSNLLNNVRLLISNTITLTAIKVLYEIVFAKANDFGILVQNRFYTVYYNFSIEEKLDWYSQFVKETKLQVNEINMFILNKAKNYTEFKQLLSEYLTVKQQQDAVYNFSDILHQLNFLTVSALCGAGVVVLSLIASTFIMGRDMENIIEAINKLLKKLGD